METKQDDEQKDLAKCHCWEYMTLKYELLTVMGSMTICRLEFFPFFTFHLQKFWISTYQVQRNLYVVHQHCENRTLSM